jgi:gas vesicle protein
MVLREHKISDLVLGFGFGAAAGCLIGVLSAPQVGWRTRRQVVSAIEDGVDYIKSTAEGSGKYIRQRTSRLQTGADEFLDRGKAAIEKGKAQIESAVEAGTDLYRAAWR